MKKKGERLIKILSFICIAGIIALGIVSIVGTGGKGGGLKMVEVEVGPEGKVIALPAGGELEIPAGALRSVIKVKVKEMNAPEDNGFDTVGPFYEFSPEHTAFMVPAILRLPYTPVSDKAHDLAGIEIGWVEHGKWVALPTYIDQENNMLVAPVTHFSRGGSANWEEKPGACCSDNSCSYVLSSQCSGVFIGRGVPCDLLSSTCENLVCCKTGLMYQFAIKGSCSGEVVDSAECELICCSDLDATDMSIVPRGNCTQEDSGTPANCYAVCCTIDSPDGSDSGVTTPDMCQKLNEMEDTTAKVDDPSKCTVCCKDNWEMRPLSECNEFAEKSDCEKVCCDIGMEHYVIVEKGRCDEDGMQVDAEKCKCEADSECNDLDPCTDDSCNEQGECVNTPITEAKCGDGCFLPDKEECETDAHCVASLNGDKCINCKCMYKDECFVDADCRDDNPDDCITWKCVDNVCRIQFGPFQSPCDDGNPCTVFDSCMLLGICEGTPKPCDTTPFNPLMNCYKTPGICNPGTGECEYPLIDGAQCANDFECPMGQFCFFCFCTSPEQCLGDNDCQDDDPDDCKVYKCEDGKCVPAQAPYQTSCNDGNPCTEFDYCDVDGFCKGTPKACDTPPDPAECYKTPGTCNSGTGDCEYQLADGAECAKDADCDEGETCVNCLCLNSEEQFCKKGEQLGCDSMGNCLHSIISFYKMTQAALDCALAATNCSAWNACWFLMD